MKKIGVFIIDDSALVRQVVTEVLAADPAIEVIGTAADPLFAIDKMAKRWPDVIVLDIEMPRMDGITFLRKIMAERPTPVVICSSLTEKGAETTMDALAAGAVAIVPKPSIGVRKFLIEDAASDLLTSVRAAAVARVRAMPRSSMSPAPARGSCPTLRVEVAANSTVERVVAIGTSTGGTQALEAVLSRLPRTAPGLVIVQHMPEKFTATFAARLNGLCEIDVREAKDNDRVTPGLALIAPGGKHVLLKRNGAAYYVEVVDGPLVNRHRPSVDVLFSSVAKFAGRNATGVIMTGMGDDGARGLKELREAGGRTIAQDEASCVVFGMPKAAIKLGAAEHVAPLQLIPGLIAN